MIVLYSRLFITIPIKRSIINLDQNANVPKEQNKKRFNENAKEYLANN
jgi:hypothetical protein